MFKVNRSVIKKIVTKFLDGKLWPEHHVFITKEMRKIIAENNIIIADVGAAGGTENRWYPIEKFIKFVCFEPDKRSSQPVVNANIINFPIGLSDKKGKKLLHLTSFPPASSLYPLNTTRLNDYADYKAHRVVDSIPVEVDTLDNCLLGHLGICPDFLKIDTEGSDLDVLKGASTSLKSVKGIRIEVSFLERHIGAPLFGEVDTFLRQRGFELFTLSRAHWIRRNLLYGANSYPQIIFGDAVYFLTKDSFMKRLLHLSDQEKVVEFIKFIIILLCHGIHDYALEVVDSVSESAIISSDLAAHARQAIKSSVDNFYSDFLRRTLAVLFGLFIYLIFLPVRPLRMMAYAYLKKHFALFARYLFHIKSGPYDEVLDNW